MDVGAEALKRGAGDFYFDKTIPIDLPGAAKSKFPDMNDSQKASIAQSAIGQYEVTVTPLQMLLVASAIANDGVIMKPHIVRSVADSYGVNLKVTDPEILARPIKKDTAQKVREMMVDVVRKGTGKRAAVEGIVVAGKTGTAETGGGRDPHSWFIAFAPAGDAKIVLAVIVEEGGTGGGKAAAITGKLIKEYLKK
jgi:peptidoglycan glycosyltransferase